jgi:hypothetical protein
MPKYWSQPNPKITKTDEQKTFEICHTHYKTIDYNSYGLMEKKQLNQQIDQEKVSVKGCIAFFKAVAEDKATDPDTRAAAAGAVAEDEARLADFESHKSCCSIQ